MCSVVSNYGGGGGVGGNSGPVGGGGGTLTTKDQLRQLFEACKGGDAAKVQQLANRSNVSARDTNGRKSTALHFAAGNRKNMLNNLRGFFLKDAIIIEVIMLWFLWFTGYGRKDIVEYLLNLGAQINSQDEGGLQVCIIVFLLFRKFMYHVALKCFSFLKVLTHCSFVCKFCILTAAA